MLDVQNKCVQNFIQLHTNMLEKSLNLFVDCSKQSVLKLAWDLGESFMRLSEVMKSSHEDL